MGSAEPRLEGKDPQCGEGSSLSLGSPLVPWCWALRSRQRPRQWAPDKRQRIQQCIKWPLASGGAEISDMRGQIPIVRREQAVNATTVTSPVKLQEAGCDEARQNVVTVQSPVLNVSVALRGCRLRLEFTSTDRPLQMPKASHWKARGGSE